jgi:hypothetical protein
MNEFKKCTFCGHRWQSRKDFLDDATTEMIGYQVNFDNLHLGLFLFNHLVPCPAKCECVYVREIMQTVRNWQKNV